MFFQMGGIRRPIFFYFYPSIQVNIYYLWILDTALRTLNAQRHLWSLACFSVGFFSIFFSPCHSWQWTFNGLRLESHRSNSDSKLFLCCQNKVSLPSWVWTLICRSWRRWHTNLHRAYLFLSHFFNCKKQKVPLVLRYWTIWFSCLQAE